MTCPIPNPVPSGPWPDPPNLPQPLPAALAGGVR